MTDTGIGAAIKDMKRHIRQIQSELKDLGEPESLPEMIQTTNIIRTNEHLTKTDQKKSELLAAYYEYTKFLEGIVSLSLEIQNDLKDILREQSELIPARKPVKSRKPAKSQRSRAKNRKSSR